MTDKKQPRKKVYEISSFFHTRIVLIVVILYVEIVLFSIVYFNYDVRIESKPLIEISYSKDKIVRRNPRRFVVIEQVEEENVTKEVNTVVEENNVVVEENNVE